MALKSRTISTSLTLPPARACPCPSSARRPGYHIIAGSEVNGSGRCFILARLHPRRFCMDGWPARSCRLAPVLWMASPLLPPPHSEPRIITLLEVTPSRPPIVGTRPKCEERQDIFHLQEQLQRQSRVLLRPLLCLPYGVNNTRGHLSLRLSGYRSLIYYRNIINGLRN